MLFLRLRNPYGEKKSYSGAWSSKSKEWKKVSDALKEELEFKNQVNGHFYILLQDFVRYFGYISFVHVNLNAFYAKANDFQSNVHWTYKEFKGAWVPGQNAGGSYTIIHLLKRFFL